ncbi:uncharacterized protein LOC130900060 isoform X1 [Diorhabda carinulata]|uniref:uncharacterized protein LOC130450330 isoform X1 n=1 Tax=Diorhabda sublineata TaxID=1163346 RepID=UPI0024E0C329|nr:uncharacterized protein LOC130450330 isoform X1 [Diorhabda sublineata]XP_057666366.1 uncharacterized protein LOC130900060 isoform X1 [Diorhabda carinulata]
MSGQPDGINKITITNSVNHHNKKPVILIYPTVSPETVVVPIISCIFGFPLLALLVICCLRRRAKLAREQARRRNCDTNHGTFSIVRFSPIHYLGRSSRAISLRSERGMSRGFPSLELDTVVEERSDPEPEQTVIEMITPDADENRSVGR